MRARHFVGSSSFPRAAIGRTMGLLFRCHGRSLQRWHSAPAARSRLAWACCRPSCKYPQTSPKASPPLRPSVVWASSGACGLTVRVLHPTDSGPAPASVSGSCATAPRSQSCRCSRHRRRFNHGSGLAYGVRNRLLRREFCVCELSDAIGSASSPWNASLVYWLP